MKTIFPYHIGQQIKILPIRERYCHPIRYYKASKAIIIEMSIEGNSFSYGICHLKDGDVNSGWWYPHECMELMLGGKVTATNLKKAIDYKMSE